LSKYELTPEGNTKVNFSTATAFVRKYVVYKKPLMLTNNHKGVRLNLDAGWIIIEKKWYPINK